MQEDTRPVKFLFFLTDRIIMFSFISFFVFYLFEFLVHIAFCEFECKMSKAKDFIFVENIQPTLNIIVYCNLSD